MIDMYAVTAADLMSTELVGIAADATLASAAEKMSENRMHCLIIPLDQPGRGLGVITGKDIIRLLPEVDLLALAEIRVSDVMSCPAVSVPPDLCVHDCVSLMLATGVRRVIVQHGADPVGILSFTDVMDLIASPSSNDNGSAGAL